MKNMIKACGLFLFLLLVMNVSSAQTEGGENLRVSPSLLQERAKGVRFQGRRLETGVMVEGEEIVYKGISYFPTTDSEGTGLVARDVKTGEKIIYEPTELALSAGWLKQRPGKGENHHDYIRGYCRIGDTIWMGTEGFGVLVFDIQRKVWTRYDRAPEPAPGRYMNTIFYADEDYVFGGGLEVYSRKLKRWLKVEAIPTRYVRSFGYSGPYVQAPWSLTQFAKEKYLPLSPYPYNMALFWPKELRLRDDGAAYIFRYEPDDAPTEFIIEKWQLEWAFSQITMNQSPQQQSLK